MLARLSKNTIQRVFLSKTSPITRPLARTVTTQLPPSGINRGLTNTVIIPSIDNVALITGNFSYFTKEEANIIQAGLRDGHVLVLIYDRDSIIVSANERAMWVREHFKHHQDLEVRVAYGAPLEQPGSEAVFSTFIKKQLPSYMTITSVRCNNFYSKKLSDDLQAAIKLLPNSTPFDSLEKLIKRDPKANQSLIMPIALRRLVSPFEEVIDQKTFIEAVESEKLAVKQDMLRLNPDHPNQHDFFKRTQWDLKALNQVNLPVVIGQLDDKTDQKSFSALSNTQVFDMPVYMPGQGFKIPKELGPYLPVLKKIVAAESLANDRVNECKMYVTIDCGIVFPSGYARRGGLHIDGFLTSANIRTNKDKIAYGDNTYIMSDNPYLQTEFYPGPFDLRGINSDDTRAVLGAFQLQGQGMTYKQFQPYQLVRLNTNHVHAVHPNLTNQHQERCFLKATFSTRNFNREGNTNNPHLKYRFFFIPRAQSDRSTQNFIGAAPKGYIQVDLDEIDFEHSKFPDWVSNSPIDVDKKTNIIVKATPATEGETLITEVDGHEVTINIARRGDIKVSRTEKDCYFLDGKQFDSLYKPTGREGEYEPISRSLKALQIKTNITFPAPWGTRQSIPAGGYIVQNGDGEMWGVHEQSFEATYQVLSCAPELYSSHMRP